MNEMLRQLHISAEIISNCCALSYFVPYLNERVRGVPQGWEPKRLVTFNHS